MHRVHPHRLGRYFILPDRHPGTADARPAEPIDCKDRDQYDAQDEIIEMNRLTETKLPIAGRPMPRIPLGPLVTLSQFLKI